MRPMRAEVVLVMSLACATLMKCQTFSIEAFVDTAMTQSQYILRNLDKYVTAEYRHRHEILRMYQRDGYSNIVMQFLDRDILSALIDCARMKLHVAYSINRGPIFYPSQTVAWFQLPFDWSFPEDPWQKPWWSK